MIKLSDQLHKCGYKEGFDPASEMRGSIAHDLLANNFTLPTPQNTNEDFFSLGRNPLHTPQG
jgi:hypothetical protein